MAKSDTKDNTAVGQRTSAWDLVGRLCEYRAPKPKENDPGLATLSVIQENDKSAIDFYLRGDHPALFDAVKLQGQVVVLSGHIKPRTKAGKAGSDYVQFGATLSVDSVSKFVPGSPSF